jgi:F0F1-type ATP synthase beta subunit
MAWGPDPNTEDELEKLAAVRGYLQQQFPGALIRDSYDAGRMAQVFRIESDGVGGLRDAVVSTEFLEEYPPEKMGKALTGLRVAEHLRSAKGKEVLVTSWGVEERGD